MPDELTSTQLGRRLGAELTHLRRMARVGGRRMASITGLSQSSVSRIESGRRRPSRPEVEAWLRETGADPDVTDRVLSLLRAVHAESMNYRDLLADTGDLQGQVAQREQAAALICDWAPDVVPGLLQTREYAEALMSLVAVPGEDPAGTVAGRMQRQGVLHAPGRTFRMLTTEVALTRPIATDGVMVEQRAHLVRQARIPGVTVGVVQEPTPVLAASGFVIYDEVADGDPFVAVELTHGPLVLADPQVVAIYRSTFEELHARAADVMTG